MIFNEPPECDFQCSHECHKHGMDRQIKECPTCGCSNPAYNPDLPDRDPDHLNPAKGGNRGADDYW